MPIKIHGKEYVTVNERVQALHELHPDTPISILTDVLNDNPVVIRAVVTIGENEFSGISAANPDKAIEKVSPYEVAETSAVGRALGFAGFGVTDSIASADEIIKANNESRI